MNPFYQNIPPHPLIAKFPDAKALVEQLYLVAILNAYPRIQKISGISKLKENGIRNEVLRDLKFNNPVISEYFQKKIIFIASENQANTSTLEQRTDLEIACGHPYCHKFVIECKKMVSAEGRYVKGRMEKEGYKHDGLEKFIDLTYAETDEEGAMLTFIVGGTPQAIIQSLNKRVLGFHPSPNSIRLSTQLCTGWNLSFQSSHIRHNGQEFRIYHLFYDLRMEIEK